MAHREPQGHRKKRDDHRPTPQWMIRKCKARALNAGIKRAERAKKEARKRGKHQARKARAKSRLHGGGAIDRPFFDDHKVHYQKVPDGEENYLEYDTRELL